MLTAVVAAAVAVASLTACNSKVGAAAFVDGNRISQTDVGRYLKPGGITPSASAAAASQGQQVESPKLEIVSLLVQQGVWRAVLAQSSGGIPTAGALAALHDAAATNLLQAQVTGASLDKEIDAQEMAYGFAPRYRPLLLNTVELEWALIERVHATSVADLAKAVAKAHVKVQVSAVYGKWDASQLGLSSPDSAVPNFVHLSGTATASAAPQG